MERRLLIAGNWKLHNTVEESLALASTIANATNGKTVDVVVAPVFTSLRAVCERLASSGVKVSAQNVYWEDRGAFTGEVSAPLLKDVGCSFCIVGHSERRHGLGETDEMVAKKIRALHRHDLTAIVCVGETLEEREHGRMVEVVTRQTKTAIAAVDTSQMAKFVIAYEPVWAIGTGRTAQPGDAEEVHAAIRAIVQRDKGDAVSQSLRIIYGGSVKPDNAKELLAQPNIDGSLVGGASLDPRSFLAIITAAETAAQKGYIAT